MKPYKLKSENRQMSFGDLEVIALGERGRGRYETLVPITPGQHSYVEITTTKSGKPKIVKGSEDNGEWLARISCQGCYTKGTSGQAYVYHKDKDQVKVVASGHGAEGAAGRIGWWADYLLQIQDNTLIRVKSHGGYKTPAYYLFFHNATVIKMTLEEFLLWLDTQDEDYNFDPEKWEKSFECIKTIHDGGY